MNFLQKLFGRENEIAISPPPTEVTDSLPPKSTPAPLTPGLHVAQKTDVGQQREKNEDSVYTITSFVQANARLEPFGVYIVADGMGGYKSGEKASSVAIKTAANYIIQNLYLPDLLPSAYIDTQTPIIDLLVSSVQEANQAVLDHTPEAGTTLTVAVMMGSQIYLAHVGDSRAYLYCDGELTQITQDHSVVARMVEVGQLTAEEALTHQNRNVLYRAIGQTAKLEVETYLQLLPPQGYLLLCSDGLWNMVSDEGISQILSAAPSLDDAVSQLVQLANENGGDDNITVILVGLGESTSMV